MITFTWLREAEAGSAGGQPARNNEAEENKMPLGLKP